MTNWMTATGIALIAAGIATLIVFRRTIWAGVASRRDVVDVSQRSARARKGPPAGPAARVRPLLPAQAGAPDISGSQQAADILAGLAGDDADNASGLASLGLADDHDDPVDEGDDDHDPVDDRDHGAPADRCADGRRRPRGGPMDMDDLRRQLRDALEDLKRERRDDPEDLKRERRDDPEPATGSDPGRTSDAPGNPERRRLAQAVLARADAGTREGARFDTASGRLVPPGQNPARTRPANGHGDRVDGWVRPQYGTPDGPTGDYWKPVPDGAYADDGSAYGWPVPVERLSAAPAYPAPAEGAIEASEPTAVVPQWPPVRPSDRIEVPRTWSVRRRPSPRPNGVADVHSTVYVSRHAAEPS